MNKQQIKNNIQTLRNQHNVSQQKLAEKLGITRTYLSKLENQKHLPTEKLIIKICKTFDKQIGEVFHIENL